MGRRDRLRSNAYQACWKGQHLPLLRVIDTVNLPPLLSLSERSRLDALTARDAVPSATLALVLQANYVSKDQRSHFAVYNFETTADERNG